MIDQSEKTNQCLLRLVDHHFLSRMRDIELNKSHFGIFFLGISVFTSGDSVGCNVYKEIF